MPSSRRDGSEGKWMCPPFLTQAKATQASLQCGTEGLLPATLIPELFIKKSNNYSVITKIILFLTIGIPSITSQIEQMYTRHLQKRCSIGEWQR